MKMFRVVNGKYKAFGHKNRFVLYGKNTIQNYRIEIKMDAGIYGLPSFKIYESKKRPIFRNICLISIPFYLLLPFSLIIVSMFLLIGMYIEGAVNFYKDTAWQNSVRYFNWANIFLILVLLILLTISIL